MVANIYLSANDTNLTSWTIKRVSHLLSFLPQTSLPSKGSPDSRPRSKFAASKNGSSPPPVSSTSPVPTNTPSGNKESPSKNSRSSSSGSGSSDISGGSGGSSSGSWTNGIGGKVGSSRGGESRSSGVSGGGLRGGLVTAHMLRIGQSVSFGIFSTDGLHMDVDGEGDSPDVDMKAHPDGKPSSSHLHSLYRYQWTHNGVDIFSIRDDGRQLKPYFILENVTSLDAGHYRCYRLSNLGRRHLVAESVIEVSTPPVVLGRGESSASSSAGSSTRQSPIVLKRGNSFFLQLEAAGYPPPVYHWLKNGYPIPSDSMLLIEGDTFSIDRAEAHHSGSYSCELGNLAGKTLWRGLDLIVTE